MGPNSSKLIKNVVGKSDTRFSSRHCGHEISSQYACPEEDAADMDGRDERFCCFCVTSRYPAPLLEPHDGIFSKVA